MKPIISVIVPVYNVEKWLNRCVESICMQTYCDLEIILVDDGATDNSGALCDELGMKDNRIKVVHKKNGGLSDARNEGLEHATGEYISFIDSDDWIEPHFFEYLFRTMSEKECDMVGCRYQKCVGGEQQTNASLTYGIEIYNQREAMTALIDNKIQQVVWNKLYKRSLIEKVLFEKGKYHEDEFWSYQVFGKIQKYAEISYIGYNYFQREDSIMGERYSLKRLHAVEAKNCRQKYIENVMPELEGKARINLVFTCLYHGQLALQQLERKERKEVLGFLKNIVVSNKLKKEDFKTLSLTHAMWMKMSVISFVLTCNLRNICGIGR